MLRLCLLLAALSYAAGALSAEPVYQRRWVYCSFNNQVEKNSEELIALMDRAKARATTASCSRITNSTCSTA